MKEFWGWRGGKPHSSRIDFAAGGPSGLPELGSCGSAAEARVVVVVVVVVVLGVLGVWGGGRAVGGRCLVLGPRFPLASLRSLVARYWVTWSSVVGLRSSSKCPEFLSLQTPSLPRKTSTTTRGAHPKCIRSVPCSGSRRPPREGGSSCKRAGR